MPKIEKYFDLVEDTNPETNQIKGYRAKREFWIKEIHFENEKDKFSKLSHLEKLKNEISIYEIIEREKVLYISIDYNKKTAIKFNEIMSKVDNNIGLKKEAIVKGNGKYSKLNEIQNLYNKDNSMCKFEIPLNDRTKFGTGFFFEIDNELGIPMKKVLFSCNHVLSEDILRERNYLEFKYKGYNEEINISNSILYYKNGQDFSNLNTSNKRKIFTDNELDYTCIELLENDGIFQNLQSVNVFKMNKNFSFVNLKNSEIFVLQFPNGDELSFALGQIISFRDCNLKHSASTDGGSSGAPIISRQNINNIIGIHFSGEKNGTGNYAHTMESILNDIKHKYSYKINTLSNNIKSLNNHSSYVNNIIILKDGRLCSCSSDQKIIIYNKYFEIETTINVNANVYYHNQLSKGNIIACCKDNTLKIYSIYDYNLINTLTGHNKPVLKVIEIGKKIISSAWDKTIKVWEKDENDTFLCSKTIQISNYDNKRINIIKVNSYKIAVASSEANLVNFYSVYDDFEKVGTINNIIIDSNGWQNSLCMIEENILLIGGNYSKGIYLVDCNNYSIISCVQSNIYVQSSLKLFNGNILIGCNDENNRYSIIEYKYENNNLIKIRRKESAHNSAILGLGEYIDGTIISSSDDRSIKLWN